MFIGRRADNSIYGCWTVKQWADQEELPDNDPAVAAFLALQTAAKAAVALPKFASADDLAAFLRGKSLI